MKQTLVILAVLVLMLVGCAAPQSADSAKEAPTPKTDSAVSDVGGAVSELDELSADLESGELSQLDQELAEIENLELQ